MEKPCDKCIVRACCTKRCIDYAIYIYKTKEYAQAGDMVKQTIENKMTAGEAIQHI